MIDRIFKIIETHFDGPGLVITLIVFTLLGMCCMAGIGDFVVALVKAVNQ